MTVTINCQVKITRLPSFLPSFAFLFSSFLNKCACIKKNFHTPGALRLVEVSLPSAPEVDLIQQINSFLRAHEDFVELMRKLRLVHIVVQTPN